MLVGELTCGMAGGVLPGDNYLVARRPDAASRTWRTAAPSCPSSLTLRTRRTCCRRNKRKGPPRRERSKRSKSCVRPSVRRLLRCSQRTSVRGTHARTHGGTDHQRARLRKGFPGFPCVAPSPPIASLIAPSPMARGRRPKLPTLASRSAFGADAGAGCLGGPAGAPKQGT